MMKLITVILLASLMQVSAASFGQSITLKEKNVTLEKMFREIRLQAGYDVLLSTNKISSTTTLDANFSSASIEEVMAKIIAGKDLTYIIEDRTILIKPGEKSILDKVIGYFVSVKISGKVRDKNGAILPGVSVKEKGESNAVSTTASGDYTISVKENATLVFSYIGYKTIEIGIGSRSVINVTLEEDAAQLKDVNVISTGYQDLNKKLFTGSATALKASDVKRDGITDVSRMLEGRVAGVSIQNVSGTFGAAPKIRVRGATSISGDNKPLWVVDGIILEDVINISNEQLSSGDANTLIGSSVAGLNADDIESFNILKDAAATAQYGARAMNGVIVVTTKKGRNTEGKPLVSYTGNFSSYLKPSYNNFDILNSADQMNVYIEMQSKGWLNQASTANNSSGGIFTKMYNDMYIYNAQTDSYAVRNDFPGQKAYLQYYANANTDWFDVLFKNSLLQEHSLSVTSGTDKSKFYASTSFLNDNGWTIGDGVKRFTGNLRGTFKLSEKLTFELLTQGSVRDQIAPGTLGRNTNPVFGTYDRNFDINPFSYAINTSRALTPYDRNGQLEYFTRDFAPFNIINELKNNTLGLTQIDFKGQVGIKYKVIKDLQYSFDGAYRFAKTNQEHKITENSNMANAYRAGIAEQNSTIINSNKYLYRNPDNPNDLPISVLPFGGFYNTVDDNITNYYFRNSLEYNKTINEDHLINIFGAQELRYINRQHKTFDGYGYQYDQGGIPFIDPNIVKQNVESNFNYYSMSYGFERYLNYSLRAAYSYKGKYSLNATGRYDGSNLLGESRNARWLPTWNISGAWNIDTENFMQKESIKKILSRATLRGTYGLVASLGPATNSSLILQSQSTLRPYQTEKETALYIAALENSQLTFEKMNELNLGVDLGFFKERLTLTVDVYNRKSFDLIGAIKTSGIGGQSIKIANYADMKANGIEATVGSAIIKKTNWGWNTQLNFAYNKSKITNLQNQPNIFNLVGLDGGAQLGYPQRGLFSIDFQGLSHTNGSPLFIKDDGTIGTNVYLQSDVTKYLKYEGPIDPTLTGGFYNAFRYKDFSLSALLTFSAGNKVRLTPIFKSGYSDLDAMSSVFLKRWEKPGDELLTNVPSILDVRQVAQLDGSPYNIYNFSTERVASADFIRLKQISLSYNVRKKLLEKFGLRTGSISFVANNVALLYSDKALNGQDPEFFGTGGVALPIPRQLTLSLKVGF